MKHLSAQECVDFVQQRAPAAHDPDIVQHLQSGCSECHQSLAAWKRVVELASGEVAFVSLEGSRDVPMSTPSPPVRLELASLASDSSRQPRAAGVRSNVTSGRQVLYQCGTISVDIRMQSAPGSGLILLIGQLLDSNKLSDRVGEIPVVLLAQGHVVSEKQTNRAGEFDFGFYELLDRKLVFSLNPKHQLIVPLPD